VSLPVTIRFSHSSTFWDSYWGKSGITLEPRLSSRWITNIAYAGRLVSLPIPLATFFLPTGHAIPNPPPLSNIMSAILPNTLTKPQLTKGLQSKSRLVQHLTANLLVKSLRKLLEVVSCFKRISNLLGEDQAIGSWECRKIEVLKDAKRRLPEVQVIIALLQHDHVSRSKQPALGGAKPPHLESAQDQSLSGEMSLRLVWLYFQSFPEMQSEARFDVGKLLFNVMGDKSTGTDSASQLTGLNQLHILRILRDSHHFTWSAKLGNVSCVSQLPIR